MKYLIHLTLFLPFTFLAQTVQPSTALQAFHDTTWVWVDDNENTFVVKLTDFGSMIDEPLDGNTMFLYYIMTSSSGEIIYETRPAVIVENGDLPFGGVLGGYNENPPKLYGQIDDFTDPDYEYWISGMLKIIYIPCEGQGCNPQISWEITELKEMVHDPSAPDDYNLPTDIILTKVE